MENVETVGKDEKKKKNGNCKIVQWKMMILKLTIGAQIWGCENISVHVTFWSQLNISPVSAFIALSQAVSANVKIL